MMQKIDVINILDADSNPTGGSAIGTGIAIEWQNGPLGRGSERKEPTGAFVEGVIMAAIKRLEFFQESKFKCRENAIALTKLEEALQWLNWRTQRREFENTEGTHTGN